MINPNNRPGQFRALFPVQSEAESVNFQDSLQEQGADAILNASPSAFYLVQLPTLQYLYISEPVANMLGFPCNVLKNNGIQSLLKHIHPDDTFLLTNFIFPTFREIYFSKAKSDVENLCFTFNYRFKHPSGNEIQILENIRIQKSDAQGNPLVIAGTMTDITSYQHTDRITVTVSLNNSLSGFKTLFREQYTSLKQHAFTGRELQIVKMLSRGMSSVEIAETLFISKQTVDKHRKNMLHKYSMKNTRELIHFVVQQGWVSMGFESNP